MSGARQGGTLTPSVEGEALSDGFGEVHSVLHSSRGAQK
jgi:hypothetical protein